MNDSPEKPSSTTHTCLSVPSQMSEDVKKHLERMQFGVGIRLEVLPSAGQTLDPSADPNNILGLRAEK